MRYTSFLFFFFLIAPMLLQAQDKEDKDEKLLLAAYNGDEKEVIRLIADSANVNACTNEGISSLMYASEKGFTEIVKILLYYNASPNMSPLSGRTALISAAIQNHQDIVYLLLVYGADINATDEYGVTAMMYAAGYNFYEMTNFLLLNGARHDIKAQDGTDALSVAAYFGNTDIVNLLCNYNADINTKDYKGFSPVTIAIQNNDLNLLDTLINRQTELKVSAKDFPSTNPLDYSRILNHRIISKRLKKEGLHGTFKPYFNKINLFLNAANFNTKDYFIGGGLGISDSKYNFSFELGINGRIAKKRILEQIPESTNEFYQLWEKRQYIYLGADKLFTFNTKNEENKQGIYLGVKGLFTFGTYQGLNRKPKSRFTYAIGAGYKYLFKNFYLKAGYEYCDLGVYKEMDHWITLAAGISIDLTKNKLHKKIYWI